jgi:hypothetical protein
MADIIQQIALIAQVPSGGAAPPTQSYSMYAGDDAAFTVTVGDAVSAAPLNLTGCVVQYIASLATGGTLWTKTAALSNQTDSTGQCVFSLTNTETAPLANNSVNHVIVVTDAANHKTTVLKGTANFLDKGI